MTTRIVEWKLPYTWGTAIEIDENKVISLRLRDENNLIIYDGWDNEIFVDLQLDDEITPTSAFPVGITTGRVVVDNWWDKAGTIICAKTTSWDNIKLLYADEWTLWIDNGTGTFKQIYFKWDVDTIVQAIYTYIDDNANTKTFFITWSSTQRKEKLWEAISYILSWKNALVNIWGTTYTWIDFTPWDVELGLDDIYTFSSAVNSSTGKYWELKVNVVYTNPHSSTVRTYTDTEHSVWGWWWSDIEYVTQAEYEALPSSKLTDNKHYFIYEEEVWPTPPFTPWVNTVAYYPLTADLNDNSWNNRNLTASDVSKITFWAYGGVNCAYFDTAHALYTWPSSLITNSAFTMSVWFKYNTSSFDVVCVWSSNNVWNIEIAKNKAVYYAWSSNWWEVWISTTADTWTHAIITMYSGTAYIYLNWQLYDSHSCWDIKWNNIGIWNNPVWTWTKYKWYMWEVIIEDKSRTAQEIQDYYDQTKSLYWIS